MFRSAHIDSFARDGLPPAEQWPELPESPDTHYSERLNAAVELLDRTLERAIAAGRPDAIALHTDHETISYRDLQREVNRIANVLRGPMGLVPGNRVLLRGANHPAMAACWLAVIKAGLVAVATMPLLRAKDLVPVIEKAQVNAALCDARLKDELLAACKTCPRLTKLAWFNTGLAEAAPQASIGDRAHTTTLGESLEALAASQPDRFEACNTAQDDVALIAFTSGTTGQPKGTLHFHRDVLAMCDLFPRHVLEPGVDDIFCGTPPIAFTFGLGGMLCFPMRIGASTLLIEKFTPDSLLDAIGRQRATICFTAPTYYRRMAQLLLADQKRPPRFDLSSLRKCVSAGEALPDATRQLWKQATGIEMIDGIGSTEMIHIFISSAGAQVRPGAIGKVVPGYEVRVVDDAMNTLPPGTIGQLAVRGPTGCRYLADERQARYVQQGWNLPGDAFLMDADGYFFYQARSDDMIVSAGYNIASPEVEACLLTHPAVAECGVIGVPDAERGQIVKAFVVLQPGQVGDETMARTLQDHVKQGVAPYKYPRAVEFRTSLPRTETGKLQRFRLRE